MECTSRVRRTGILFLIPFLATIALIETGESFHSGGVGDCSGCHNVHSPSDDRRGTAADNSVRPAVLSAADAGSACLKCHLQAGERRTLYHLVATADADMPAGLPPVQLTPGGDFGWLKKSYRWGTGGGEGGGTSAGERHGHSIVAFEYGFTPDALRPTAPGGTFPTGRLTCISCHDPHGRYRRYADGSIGTGGASIQASGSYNTSPDPAGDRAVGVFRLLGGKGYTTSLYDGTPFTADPPAAVSPEEYNRPEDLGDTRVAYGKGMSEWCANCHAAMLGGGAGAKAHPAGNGARMTARVVANYNAYVASGNLTGSAATAYTSMVPFEMGTADYGVLKGAARSQGASAGPDATAKVMCLTCHRAHASAWDHATRWNMRGEFLVYNGNYPGVDDASVPPLLSQGRTRAETRKAFYDRPATAYTTYQRSLCNKCHAKD